MSPVEPLPVRGRAFAPLHRLLASVVVLLALGGLLRLVLIAPEAIQGSTRWWLLATALMLLVSYAMIMLSSTTVDAEGILQTGLPERRVRWQDIDFAQVAGWPLARRLRVRTVAGKRVVFGGSGAVLLAAFERIAAAYPRR